MHLRTLLFVLLIARVGFGQVSVVNTTPAPFATGVPLTTTVTVTFSGPVDTTYPFDIGGNYFTNVTTLNAQWWSTDRRTISFAVELQPSSVYFLLIHSVHPATGGGFPVPYAFYWTTGTAFPTDRHSVSGTIIGTGTVTPDNAIVGLGASPFTGGPPPFVGVAVTNALGQFTVPYVSDGTWYPIAAKDADLNGEIDPSRGDPIAFGDSVIVNGSNVSGLVLHFMIQGSIRFSVARESIAVRAAQILPPERQLRQFYAWQVDSTGAAKEFGGSYTVPGSSIITEVWMEAFGVQSDTSTQPDSWFFRTRPFGGLASAALLDSVVARAERMGGAEFRRQSPPVPGSFFSAYAKLGDIHDTEFGRLIPDTSQNYWGLQYAFQLQVTPDSTTAVQYMMFVASAASGAIIGTTGIEAHSPAALPSAYALRQNYPNPFNPATTITFTVPVQSRVRVDVFTVLGQKVATLVDDVRESGEHHVRWTAAVASGTYFCRMEATALNGPMRPFVQVRPMVVLK